MTNKFLILLRTPKNMYTRVLADWQWLIWLHYDITQQSEWAVQLNGIAELEFLNSCEISNENMGYFEFVVQSCIS